MSRASAREDDGDATLPDRPPSPHRNLVTPDALAMLGREPADARESLARPGAA